ncbi:hypothetical protein PILCRDRAFT_665502 [Piloderma croceum F 1598]|uniref:Uncharacterized protein n=1 Tax=Piloderma croceum (strain F 1598) TaxID=765440 RepID=A0A0C3ETF6_PILCF|nr:hypothetical protein PILCRDRAFT_665502 [Piloderma croceum F 1598]
MPFHAYSCRPQSLSRFRLYPMYIIAGHSISAFYVTPNSRQALHDIRSHLDLPSTTQIGCLQKARRCVCVLTTCLMLSMHSTPNLSNILRSMHYQILCLLHIRFRRDCHEIKGTTFSGRSAC